MRARPILLASLIALAAPAAAEAQAQTPPQPAGPPAATSPAPGPSLAPPPRFTAAPARLPGGAVGRILAIPSANPAGFEDIIAGRPGPAVALDGQLFLPDGPVGRRWPVVIIVPGSGGVSAPMLGHADALVTRGIGVFVLDPFAGRGVRSTVADQSQFTFAASAYDVLAAAKTLRALPQVDGRRIGAMGYSRGGFAVLLAAAPQISEAVIGRGVALRAIVPAWAWCGVQFERPMRMRTSVRFLLGATDNWVSPIQCQAQAEALRGAGADVSVRLFEGAGHGFGYGAPLTDIPRAQHSLMAPVIHLDARGAYLDPYTGEARPGMSEAQLAEWFAPWAGLGVRAGARPGQREAFTEDMAGFFAQKLR